MARWKFRRRRLARALVARTGTGPIDPEEPDGGNGNGNGNGGDGGNGGNGNGDWETPTPEVPEEELPDPPPGLWPGPTVVNPVVKLDADQVKLLPPGGIWPRPEHDIGGVFAMLCKVPSHGWKTVIIDPDAIKHPEVTPEPLKGR